MLIFQKFHPCLRSTLTYHVLVVLLLTTVMTGCTPLRESGRDTQLPASQMIETGDLGEVTREALRWAGELGNDQVLVVFDLDNTLMAMEQDLGSDQWYDWQKSLAAENPCDERLVTNLLAVQGALYYASAMRMTQPDAASQVGQLQKAGLNVFALTSRGPDFQLQTFRELRRNDYRFYHSAIGPEGGYPEPFVPAGGKRPALYEDGVFLTAGQHKGRMLQALLDKTGTPSPALIFMVDDKVYNLENVLEAFEQSTTSVQAYRYNREDTVIDDFDPEKADAQWQDLSVALQAIQRLVGPDNFELPPQELPVECTVGSE